VITELSTRASTSHEHLLLTIRQLRCAAPPHLTAIIQGWTTACITISPAILQSYSMPGRPHHVEMMRQGVPEREHLFDDATSAIPTVGLKTPLRLRDRFAYRLSSMASATVAVDNEGTQNAIVIRLPRKSSSDQSPIELDNELRRFLHTLEESLVAISTHPTSMFAPHLFPTSLTTCRPYL
jgi:hypothetical protein